MSNSVSHSQVSQRQHAETAPRSQVRYDSTDAPVLIRLPDLSLTNSSPTSSRHHSRSSDRQRSRGKGRNLRSDRSHGSQRHHHGSRSWQSRSAKTAAAEPIYQSKILIATVVLAAIGITYVLFQGGGKQAETPPAGDPWAVELPDDEHTEYAGVDVVMPEADLDLWPGQGHQGDDPQALPLNPARGLNPRSGVAQEPAHAWPDAPGSHPSSIPSEQFPVFSIEPQVADQIGSPANEAPAAIPAQPVSSRTSPGWPDAPNTSHDTPAERGIPGAVNRRFETKIPSVPTYSAPAYAEHQELRTGRRDTADVRGGVAATPQQASRLDGNIQIPSPQSSISTGGSRRY